VWTLLGLLALQVVTGLVADDEIATTGPLNRFFSSATASVASAWHGDTDLYVLVGLLLLHVAAVTYYAWIKRKNLIAPMIHGDKPLPAGAIASADGAVQRVVALFVFAAALALAWWVGSLGEV
jgi:cytochrome b